MYKQEATEYDLEYVKKYDEDLSTTLIFVCSLPIARQSSNFFKAGLFSAVSSAFVIAIQSNLQPDPNQQSVAILHLILLTLNQSAVLNETLTVPPVRGNPPSEIVIVSVLTYASLLISLLAAFTAMLGKQWLNRYLRHVGGSTIERCGDRQRKCDGLAEWPFQLFIESLPIMLQVSLLLLACGLCQYMWSINTTVAYTLIALTALGVLFYLTVVVASVSSYACPFQTPASAALRSLWKEVGHRVDPVTLPIGSVAARLFRVSQSTILRLWAKTRHSTTSAALCFVQMTQSLMGWARQHLYHLPPSVPLGDIEEDPRVAQETDPLPEATEMWLMPTTLAALRKTNADDVRCVSWILWSITDPEALDAAVRLASTIRWFEDGLKVEPPYHQIVSTLKACFDSTGKVYPGSRDRAYYSARSILWIHICATFVSEEFPNRFPLPTFRCDTTTLDHDLKDLLEIFRLLNTPNFNHISYHTSLDLGPSDHTPAHSQWFSNALLNLIWAKQSIPPMFDWIAGCRLDVNWDAIPLNAILNRLLVSCILLGWPVEQEVLKVQDKSCVTPYSLLFELLTLSFASDRLEQIVSQLSQAITSAICTSHPRCNLLPVVLDRLSVWGNRPSCLTRMAYWWCSVICENYRSLKDGDGLLLLSLEVGFRHLNPHDYRIEAELTHTEHHQRMIDIVFESGDDEVIADLLHAWTSYSGSHKPPPPLSICAMHLICLQPSSQRLRRLVIRAIGSVGYQEFKQAGAEEFFELLNHLHASIEDMDDNKDWATLLLDIIEHSEGIRRLPHSYWRLLVELLFSESQRPRDVSWNPHIITSLEREQEWDKLECWMGVVWMAWPPEGGKTTEEDLERVMRSLSHHRRGAIQSLGEWMERWGGDPNNVAPESFQRTCEQVRLKATRQNVL